jgi:Putative zincin peptidase
MFFIPGLGIVVAMLTFPGVIVHEAAHLFFCRVFKVPVYQVCFFRVGNPCGFVVHESTENFTALFFISMGPFFANTLLCILFCTAAFLPVYELKVFDPLGYFFYWLGISIGMHAFPSTTDLTHVWDEAPRHAKRGNPLAILSLPLAGILVILNYGRVIWADLWYGVAVGILAPIAIFKALIL